MKFCCNDFKAEYEAGDDYIRHNTNMKFCPYCGKELLEKDLESDGRETEDHNWLK